MLRRKVKKRSPLQVVKDAGGGDSVEVDNRRVLLIGIDGLRGDALQKVPLFLYLPSVFGVL